MTPASEHDATRRTFAIISHPDAGKTTLTEHLLLASGAIHIAGHIRARGQRRRTRSDWMSIERQRGISVAASLMTFSHERTVFNLLDTPGHEDFCEDTYRTLTAADSAVMIIDAARGIEDQTRKLFEICRLRDIPICTFINKLDREAMDPLELVESIGEELALDTAPLYWPLGSGQAFLGMQCLRSGEFISYEDNGRISAEQAKQLNEEAQMAKELCGSFDHAGFLEGRLTPILFGAALKGFGVPQLLQVLTEFAPPPLLRPALLDGRAVEIAPDSAETTGFVFRIQANMDPKHRDRIAFIRLCSGQFRRGDKLKTATGKTLCVNAPVTFLAQDRQLAETARAGDIIGVPGKGVLKVGDSVSTNGRTRFSGIPSFAPEILRKARARDPMKAKHLHKALAGLAEEGVTQLFRTSIGSELIIGAVGQLQIDVMAERVTAENKLDVLFEASIYVTARWLDSDSNSAIDEFIAAHRNAICFDIDGDPVFLAKSTWEAGYMAEKNQNIRFNTSKDRHN